MEQIRSRGTRLHAAGEIHRFHRDVGELLARAADKRAQLAPPRAPRDLPAAAAARRDHDNKENDLLAIDAQVQVCLRPFERPILRIILFAIIPFRKTSISIILYWLKAMMIITVMFRRNIFKHKMRIPNVE